MITLGSLLRDFAEWTTAHGVPHIVKAQTVCIRVVWILITIASLAVFTYQLSYLISRYLDYDVTIDMELKFGDQSFPAVTICNLNPYKDSLIDDVPQLREMIEAYSKRMEGNESLDMVDSWGFEKDEMESENLNLRAQVYMNVLINAYLADKPTLDVERPMVSNSTTACPNEDCLGTEIVKLSALEMLTYDIRDLVKSCSYGDQECDLEKDFVKLYDPTYGACYAFNFFDPPKFWITKAGEGLKLVLVSDQSDYLELTEAVGVKIAIHTAKEDPFPDSFGYNSAVGMDTVFAAKYVQTDHLEPPWGQCSADMTKLGLRYYYPVDRMSSEGCYRSCLQDHILRQCHCADPQYGVPGKGEELCFVKDVPCLIEFYQNKGEATCDCPSPCQKASYGVTVSTALWPASPVTNVENKLGLLKNRDCSAEVKEQKKLHNDTCMEWYRNNAMRVEVYFERMNYLRLSEQRAYDWFTLASDIGGQLGLWLGASVITVIEFLSFGILLMLFLRKKHIKRLERKKMLQQTKDAALEPQAVASPKDLYGPPPDDRVRSKLAWGDPDLNYLRKPSMALPPTMG